MFERNNGWRLPVHTWAGATLLGGVAAAAAFLWSAGGGRAPAPPMAAPAYSERDAVAAGSADGKPAGLRGPVLTYWATPGGLEHAGVGFPNLLVYANGAVITSGPSSNGGTLALARRVSVAPSEIAELLGHLAEAGIASVPSGATRVGGFDSPTTQVEVRVAGRLLTQVCYARSSQVSRSKRCSVTWKARAILDRFAAGLQNKGATFVPSSIVVDIASSQGLGLTADPAVSTPRQWPKDIGFNLYDVAQASINSLRISASKLGQFQAIANAYEWVTFTAGPLYPDVYVVRWRPAYPGE